MFKNEEGFSLLEIVVAVGVAGIIAAVALPTFAGLQTKAETTSATYAASASAAEALANSTMGLAGSTGSASSSSNQVSSQPITVTAADFAPATSEGNTWAFAFNANAYENNTLLPTVVAGDVVDWSTSFSPVREVMAYVALDGITAEKAASIAAAIDNGATTVILDGTSYNIVSIFMPMWNGSQHIATNTKYYLGNHNYSNGKSLQIYISGIPVGQWFQPTSVTVQ